MLCIGPSLISMVSSSVVCYANTLNLHSSPTRRSSDLEKAGSQDPLERRPGVRLLSRHAGGERPGAGDRLRRDEIARSEEHTSELQSLRQIASLHPPASEIVMMPYRLIIQE